MFSFPFSFQIKLNEMFGLEDLKIDGDKLYTKATIDFDVQNNLLQNVTSKISSRLGCSKVGSL